jgi:hypothetical protein
VVIVIKRTLCLRRFVFLDVNIAIVDCLTMHQCVSLTRCSRVTLLPNQMFVHIENRPAFVASVTCISNLYFFLSQVLTSASTYDLVPPNSTLSQNVTCAADSISSTGPPNSPPSPSSIKLTYCDNLLLIHVSVAERCGCCASGRKI